MRFATLFLAAWAGAGLLVAADPVRIDSGLVSEVEESGLRVYRGIPYAAPPVGELRWRAPRPAPGWKGVRRAEQFGPACVQPERALNLEALGETGEDCLTLNIWTPAKEGGERLPVMVWIHGGAFLTGSGSLPVYDGGALARQGLVMVTINYRLGDFGLFAHPALSKAQATEPLGNYALMDQVAALRWVGRNIAAFGGDPKQVTIFGESAGGSSVLFLMVSPEARGLFQRAIVESGGGTQAPRGVSVLETAGQRIAEDLGVSGDADPLRALRDIPAAEFLRRIAAARLKRGERLRMGAYQPVIDGKVVVGAPAALFEAGRQAAVPLIIGANSYEGVLMRLFGMSTEEVLLPLAAERKELRRVYLAETKDDPDLLAAKLFGDAMFVAPARFLAGMMERVKQPAWLYHFSYVYEKRQGSAPGAPHGAEIPLVFKNLGTPLLAGIATDADRKMAERVSPYWVRFAKTGNPNPPGRRDWPSYDRNTDQLLEFGEEIAVRTHFRKEQLDLLESRWREREAYPARSPAARK